MALPPFETRDGSQARATATDAEEWRAVWSMDGWVYWMPPEVAHLAADGTEWEQLETLLLIALRARATAGRTRPTREHSARPATLAAAAAFVAYHDAGEPFEETMPPARLAKAVAEFAATQGLDEAEILDGAGTVMRDMAAAVLRSIRKVRGHD